MERHLRFVFLLILAILSLLALLVYKSSPHRPSTTFSYALPSGRAITYGNLTCDTWKNFSYVDEKKYQQCLGWKPNHAFWPVAGLRHTSYKHLLDASSLIIEVGGNRGEDTIKFIELYNASIISYEPLTQMWKGLLEQFKSYPRAEFHPYGFGAHARTLKVELNDRENTGTSIFRPLSSSNSSRIQEIELLNIVEVMRKIRETRTKDGMIDMISINCEGCEFEIIPALIFNNMIQYFRIIQFASHMAFLPNSSCIYCQIEQTLERTHQPKYHYKMLWEGWVLKNTTNQSRAP